MIEMVVRKVCRTGKSIETVTSHCYRRPYLFIMDERKEIERWWTCSACNTRRRDDISREIAVRSLRCLLLFVNAFFICYADFHEAIVYFSVQQNDSNFKGIQATCITDIFGEEEAGS